MSFENKGEFLNKIIPVAFLALLNAIAIIIMGCKSPDLSGTDFLAWFAVIGLLVVYLWIVKPFTPQAPGEGVAPKREPPVDLTKTLEVAARLDQIVGDIEYLKRSGTDLKTLKQDVAALQQHTTSPESLRADIARLRDDVGTIQKLASEVSHLKDMVEKQGKKDEPGRVEPAELERLSAAIAEIEEQLRQGKGGAEVGFEKLAQEVEDLRRDEQSRESDVREVAEAIQRLETSLKQSQDELNHKATKEEIASLQKDVGDATAIRDEIARFNGELARLQDLSAEVANLKESAQDYAKLQQTQTALQADNKELASSAKDIKKQLKALQAALDEAPDAKAVECLKAKIEGELEGLRSHLDQAVNPSQLKEVSDGLMAEIESLHGAMKPLQDGNLGEEIETLKEQVAKAVQIPDVEKLAKGVKEKFAEVGRNIASLGDELGRMREQTQSPDSLKEVEEAVAGIRADAEEMREALRELSEKGDVEAQITQLGERIDGLKDELSRVTSGVQRTTDELQETVDKSLIGIKKELTETQKEIQRDADITEKVTSLDDDVASLREALTSMQQIRKDLAETKSELSSLKGELGPLQDIPSQIEKLKADVKEQLSAVESPSGATETNEELEQALSAIHQRISAVESLAKEAGDTEKIESLSKELADVRDRLSGLSKVKGRLDAVAEKAEHIDALTDRVGALSKSVADARDTDALEQKLSEVRSEQERIAEDVGKLSALQDEMAQVDGLQQKLEALAQDAERMNDISAELETLAAKMEDAPKRDAIEEHLSQLRNEQAQLAKALGELPEVKGTVDELTQQAKENGERIHTQIDKLSEIEKQLAGIPEIESVLGQLRKQLSDVSTNDRLAEATHGLQGQIDQLKSDLEKAAGAKDVDQISVRQEEAVSEVRERIEEISASGEEQLKAMRESLEMIAHENERAARELAAKIEKEKAEADSLTQEQLDAVQDDLGKAIEELNSRLDEEKTAAAEALDKRLAESRQAIDAMKQEFSTMGERQTAELQAEQVKDEMAKLQSGLDQIRSDMDEQVTQITARFAEEMAQLREEMETREEAPPQSEAIAQEIQFLREGLTVLEQVAEEVTTPEPAASEAAIATATEEAQLTINVKESSLVRTKEGTRVDCLLTITNPSDSPVEIIAVRAELDSGKDRMTPTVNKYWLPVGVEPDGDRSLALPFRVLDSATTEEIRYAITGWPLEKSKESYDFTIVLLDEHKQKHTATFPLAPPA